MWTHGRATLSILLEDLRTQINCIYQLFMKVPDADGLYRSPLAYFDLNCKAKPLLKEVSKDDYTGAKLVKDARDEHTRLDKQKTDKEEGDKVKASFDGFVADVNCIEAKCKDQGKLKEVLSDLAWVDRLDNLFHDCAACFIAFRAGKGNVWEDKLAETSKLF